MAKAKKKVTSGGKLGQGIRKMISKREDMPSSAFLVPGEKKYPVKKKNPKTGKWEYNANMVLAAQRRAIMQGRTDIAARAKGILRRITGK